MSKDDGIVGSIAALTPEEQKVRDKRDHYRKKSLVVDDAVYDTERGLFMIHGHHATLAGVDAVIAMDVASVLAMVAGIIPTVLIPMCVARSKQAPANIKS